MGLEGLNSESAKDSGKQSKKQKGGKHAAQRGQQGNKLKQRRGLHILERVYLGSPRWDHSATADEHTREVFKKSPQSDVNREKRVVEKINDAWDTPQAKFPPAIRGAKRFNIMTCVNPWCLKRTQVQTQPEVFRLKQHNPNPTCDTCGESLVEMMVRPIKNKWLYVVIGNTGNWKLRYEIYAQETGKWIWLHNPPIASRKRRKLKGRRVRRTAEGARIPVPDPDSEELMQFFLSPVQLSKHGLTRLLAHANAAPAAAPTQPANERGGKNEQLDAVTVRRSFNELASGTTEIVPVLDPFSWAEEVNAWDYEPLADAWFTFAFDQAENSKRQIAAIMTALADNNDPHDIIDEMNDKKKRWSVNSSAKHQAKAWLERYEKCRDFIRDAQNEAAKRLAEWMESAAHAIVEIACQQELDTPGHDFLGKTPLSLGVLHFANVLEHLLSCAEGAAYVTRLQGKKKRLPHRFILHASSKDEKQIMKVRDEIGDVPAILFGIFMPKVVLDAPLYGEAKKVAEHLGRLGVEVTAKGDVKKATPFGHAELVAKVDTVMELNDAMIKVYKEGFLPEELAESTAWKLRVRLGDILKAYELWTGFKAFTQDGDYTGDWEAFKAFKKKADYVHNVANFIVSQGKLSFGWYIKVTHGVELNKLLPSSQFWKQIIPSSEFARYEKMIGYYRGLNVAGKFLGGPVAFVMSGFDYVCSPPDLISAWEANKVQAIGTAMQYYGTGLLAAAALLQTIGMMSSIAPALAAGAAAMVNPVLLIALVITIVGALIFWGSSQNELEKYALHCFLGDDYGKGRHVPKPWANLEYENWAWQTDKQRYAKQMIFLMNLVGSFKVYKLSMGGSYRYIRGGGKRHRIDVLQFGGYVLPGYMPPGAKAEVFVEGYYKKTDGKSALPLKTIAVVDMDSGQFVTVGDATRVERVEAIPAKSWGTEEFRGFSVQLRHKMPDDYEEPKPGGYHWTFGARMDLTGTGKHYLPRGWQNYVELDSHKLYSKGLSSLDVASKANTPPKKKAKKSAPKKPPKLHSRPLSTPTGRSSEKLKQ